MEMYDLLSHLSIWIGVGCEQLKAPQNAVLSKLSLITPCELLSLPCVAQQQPGRSWQDPASSVTSAHAASRPTPGLVAGTTEDKRGQLRTSDDKRGQQHEGGADTGPAGAHYSRWVQVTVYKTSTHISTKYANNNTCGS